MNIVNQLVLCFLQTNTKIAIIFITFSCNTYFHHEIDEKTFGVCVCVCLAIYYKNHKFHNVHHEVKKRRKMLTHRFFQLTEPTKCLKMKNSIGIYFIEKVIKFK